MIPSSEPPLPVFETPVGPRVVVGGRPLDYFAGSGYLGFYDHPEIIEAAREATRLYGMRPAGRGSAGCHPPIEEFCRNAIRFFGTEEVTYFSSGYAGNAMLAAALRDRYDFIFLDAEAHSSVVEGALIQQKPIARFAHLDPEDLERQLAKRLKNGQRPIVMTDGMFPVTGAIPPLPAYRKVLEDYEGALLCVDDAHAAGVLGENGRGSLEHFGIHDEHSFGCATMSKAFGAFGGVIAGTRALRDAIRANSAVFHGAGDPPPGCAAAAAKALEIVMARPEIRRDLFENVKRARAGLHRIGLAVDPDHPSPIIAVDRRSGLDLKKTRARLHEEAGIYTRFVERYASAPEGGAIRIAVFATHGADQIGRLIEAFSRFGA